MQYAPARHLVVSISRTRDPLKENPGWLAEVLAGERTVRLSRGHPEARLDLDALGAVVLWSKDPRALLAHRRLAEALSGLNDRGVPVVLQLSVTGLGGTPVEPGIPSWPEVQRTLDGILRAGLVAPAAVKLRYDPVIALRDVAGRLWSNASLPLFVEVLDAFRSLGVSRATASLAQIDAYPRVANRLLALGFLPELLSDGEGRAFLRQVAALCTERGVAYSTCVFPPDASSLLEGCVDGRWLNGLLEAAGSARRVTGVLHNQRGSQRPDCRCTFSYDLGASAGIGHCYDARERWCVYCYSAAAAVMPRQVPDRSRPSSPARKPRPACGGPW